MAGCGWGPHNEAGKENQSAATKSAKMPTVLGAFPPLPPAPGGGYWRVHPVRERRQHAGITRLDHTFDQKKIWSKTFFGKIIFRPKTFFDFFFGKLKNRKIFDRLFFENFKSRTFEKFSDHLKIFRKNPKIEKSFRSKKKSEKRFRPIFFLIKSMVQPHYSCMLAAFAHRVGAPISCSRYLRISRKSRVSAESRTFTN